MNDCMRTALFSSEYSCWGNFSCKLDKKVNSKVKFVQVTQKVNEFLRVEDMQGT